MKKFMTSVNHCWVKYSALISFLFFAPIYPLKANSPENTCFFEFAGVSPSPHTTFKEASGVNAPHYTIKDDETAIEAFENMVKDGKKCTALTISGHHIGDWSGEKKKMKLKELEALSCKDEYKEWFANIKVLYLDGCNTVTDNKKDKDGDTAVLKVAKKLMDKQKKDDPYDSFDMLAFQQGYAASLDKHTPFSSRYLRIAPNATLFGFNGVAPENDKRHRNSFIAKHMLHLSQALNLEDQEDKKSKLQQGLEALFLDPCDPKTEKAWKKVWERGPEKAKNKDYTEARQLGCDLIKAKQVLDSPNSSKEKIQEAKQKILNTLKQINQSGNKNLGHILFNNLYDTWNTAKNFGMSSAFTRGVKASLKAIFEKNPQNPYDKNYSHLKVRIEDESTGSLRKGDYLKFYTELYYNDGQNDEEDKKFVKEQIQELINKKVVKGIVKDDKEEVRRILAVSVVDQLHQYGLLSDDDKKCLSKNLPPNTEQSASSDNDKKCLDKNIRLFSGTNPFVVQTQIELEFSTKTPKDILDNITGQTDEKVKRLKIFAAAKNWLNQNDIPSLSKLGQYVFNHLNENTYSGFINAVRVHLFGKTDKEIIDTLFEISRKRKDTDGSELGPESEQLTIAWANKMLDTAQKDALFRKMTTETHYFQRSDYSSK